MWTLYPVFTFEKELWSRRIKLVSWHICARSIYLHSERIFADIWSFPRSCASCLVAYLELRKEECMRNRGNGLRAVLMCADTYHHMYSITVVVASWFALLEDTHVFSQAVKEDLLSKKVYEAWSCMQSCSEKLGTCKCPSRSEEGCRRVGNWWQDSTLG